MKDIDVYQISSATSAAYPEQGTFLGLVYLSLKMNGEAGEVAEKIGKLWRDRDGVLDAEDKAAIVKELGDVAWYWAMIARELGVLSSEVLEVNVEKRASRMARGKVKGSGDDR